MYGYLSKEDIVYSSKGKVSCTIGEKGSSCLVLSTIRNLIHGTIGKNTLEGIHINFMHTIGLKFKEKGRILSTIEKIEDNIEVLEAWKKYNSGEELEAIFVVKAYVSLIDISFLQKTILEFQTKLLGIGYYIFSVDYTRDLSGTMSRQDLVSHLVDIHSFQMEGEPGNHLPNIPTICNNVRSVGNNVLTYIHTRN